MKPYHAKSKSKGKPYSMLHWHRDQLNLAQLENQRLTGQHLDLQQRVHCLVKQVHELEKQLAKRPCAI